MDAMPSFGVTMISEVPSNPQLTLALASRGGSRQSRVEGQKLRENLISHLPSRYECLLWHRFSVLPRIYFLARGLEDRYSVL